MFFQKIIRYLATALLSFSLLINPIYQNTACAFSIGEEKEIGEKLLSMVRKSFKLLDEPDIHQYINELGKEILSVTGTQFFDYHFFVINNHDFNAFAAPSGLIFIHSGLIEAMDTEGELISVLAHECGHVSSRHIADRIKKSSKTSIATVALILAGIAIGGGALSEALITGSMAAGTSLNLKFSRQDEEEADRLAYEWMQALGSDTHEMASMLNKMHKTSVYRMANIPPYLLTHPEPKRRFGYVQDLIMMNGNEYTPTKRDNFDFLRIKYRILSLTKKPADFKKIVQHNLTKKESSPLEKAMAQYGLYLSYLNEANFEKAEFELLEVISQYPNKAILTSDLGVIYLKSGNSAKALDSFNTARQLDPNSYFNKFNLAQAWHNLGEEETALNIYNELLANNPDYARIHYLKGQIKIKQGKKGEGHYHLGLYFWYEGDPKLAKLHLDQCIASDDSTPDLKKKAEDFKKKMKELEKT